MQFVTLEFLWEVEVVVRLVQLGYFQFSRHPPPTKWASRSYLDKNAKKGQVGVGKYNYLIFVFFNLITLFANISAGEKITLTFTEP